MPLFVSLTAANADGEPEIRRVIPGHREAAACEASPAWQRISEQHLADLRDGAELADVVADAAAEYGGSR